MATYQGETIARNTSAPQPRCISLKRLSRRGFGGASLAAE
jgi:hypothetical protein